MTVANRLVWLVGLFALQQGCSVEVIDTLGVPGGSGGDGGEPSSDGGGGAAPMGGAGAGGAATPPTSAGGGGGTGGTSTIGCTPGETQPCYDGPPGTEGVGICVAGTRQCLADGSGFGVCAGQMLPASVDNCVTPEDDDCDGMVAVCQGFLPAPPTAGSFAWQGLQEHFVVDGVPCVGEVSIGLGDRSLCYAGADDHLYCAGAVSTVDFGQSFVDTGIEGPLQIMGSMTVNSENGNNLCVVLRNGTMQCLGGYNDHGQLGSGDTLPLTSFQPWGGLSDIVRGATGTYDQMCVLRGNGQVWCAGYGYGVVSQLAGSGASSVWVDTFGDEHLDPPTVWRASAGRAECQVTPAGLTCNFASKGLPGTIVDGGLFGPFMEEGCLLDAGGSVTCFSLESILEGSYFEQGSVVALATNPYSPNICAVYADGSLWCMGPNLNGELGTGDDQPLISETMVAPPGSVRAQCQ